MRGMKMKKLLVWFQIVAVSLLPVMAQNPQSSSAPIYSVNAKYTNGTAPGYYPTQQALVNGSGGTIAAATGLNINLGPGTANCGSGTIVTYAGGTFALTASATNRIYLDTTSSCAPAVKTTAFASTDIPIASVVTSGTAITSISDVRTPFAVISSGSPGINQLTGDVAAGPGSGSQTSLLKAINGVPLCTGFSPSADQSLTYRTDSSPDPCWGPKSGAASGITSVVAGNGLSINEGSPCTGPTCTIVSPFGDPAGSKNVFGGNSWFLINGQSFGGSPGILSYTASSCSSSDCTITNNSGTDPVVGKDVAIQPTSSTSPACLDRRAFTVTSVQPGTSFHVNAAWIGCGTTSGGGGVWWKADTSVPETACSLPGFLNNACYNYSKGGSDWGAMDSTFSSDLGPAITTLLSGMTGQPLRLWLYNTATNGQVTDEGHMLSIAAKAHALGSNVQVYISSVEYLCVSPDSTSSHGNGGDWSAESSWMGGHMGKTTATVTGQYFDDVINLHPTMKTSMCGNYGSDAHLNDGGTSAIAHVFNAEVTAPGTSLKSDARAMNAKNYFFPVDFSVYSGTRQILTYWVKNACCSSFQAHGWGDPFTVGGGYSNLWEEQDSGIVASQGKGFGGRRFTTDGWGADSWMCRDNSTTGGRWQIGTSCQGNDGGTNQTYVDWSLSTTPSDGASCSTVPQGRMEGGTDHNLAICGTDNLWHRIGGSSITWAGDLAGSSNSTQKVSGLNSVPFCTGYTPTNGQVVQYTTGGTPSPCYGPVSLPSGTFSALSGDAISTATGGATTVTGINNVPLCTGFSPTNGQILSYTTASSPNPCYTAASAPSGSFSALTGDATSTATGGATTVTGLKNVPFCTGFTPTNGQTLQYTTASSPNPCYTAATGSGGSSDRWIFDELIYDAGSGLQGWGWQSTSVSTGAALSRGTPSTYPGITGIIAIGSGTGSNSYTTFYNATGTASTGSFYVGTSAAFSFAFRAMASAAITSGTGWSIGVGIAAASGSPNNNPSIGFTCSYNSTSGIGNWWTNIDQVEKTNTGVSCSTGWHILNVSVSGTTASFYVDGTLVDTQTATTGTERLQGVSWNHTASGSNVYNLLDWIGFKVDSGSTTLF